ncbi:Serine/threonine-protein kinase HT1 [Hordeum vulgare]|nr:Serine/threonine-protein kinase HT1 [Hordeum vulgare]
MAGSDGALGCGGRERQPGAPALVGWARAVSRARGAVALAGGRDGAWRPCSAVGGGGYPAQLREKSLLRSLSELRRRRPRVSLSFLEASLWSAGRLRQEVERLRLARNFDGAVKSCPADRCYAESCLVGSCYARQIFRSLRIWTDERRTVAPLGAVVASTDDWPGKDDANLFPEDGSVVRG